MGTKASWQQQQQQQRRRRPVCIPTSATPPPTYLQQPRNHYICSHVTPQHATQLPQLCKECFYTALEDEVHQTIVNNRLFKRGERVAVAASGGKDSTVLAHMLTLLNDRHE
jgi:hypothetical protein